MRRERALKVVMVVVGLLFVAGIYPVALSLQHAQAEVEPMMLSIYVIAFTAWSSFAHAAIMVMQAIRDAGERGHLLAGVALFGVIGVALLAVAPTKQSIQRAAAVSA